MCKLPEEEKGKVTIRPFQTKVTTQTLSNFDPRNWLKNQQTPYIYLLAHAFDGVIWGKRGDGGWQLSCDLTKPASPNFTQDELLELRIFSPEAEIYVWREDQLFKSRTIKDGVTDSENRYEAYDEPQLLWGTKGQMRPGQNTFVRLEDGSQGLVHYVPLPTLGNFPKNNEPNTKRPVSLCIRHYVRQDSDTGLARVTMSRLFDLTFDLEEEANGSQA